jgi:hypothetical protein
MKSTSSKDKQENIPSNTSHQQQYHQGLLFQHICIDLPSPRHKNTFSHSFLISLCFTGHDVKSLLLNLSAILTLLSPLFFYVHYGGILFSPKITIWIRPHVPSYLIWTGLCIGITFLIPPMGFYRPHVYSDWGARNQPMYLVQQPKKKKNSERE